MTAPCGAASARGAGARDDDRWLESRYGGLFTESGPLPLDPGAPDLALHAGALAPWGPRAVEVGVGGAGTTAAAARGACLGEAVERAQSHPLPCDAWVEASAARWPLDEPFVAPDRWVLFLPAQHAQPGFPFAPFTRDTVCRWVAFREAGTGAPRWVPEEFAFLFGRAGADHRLGPSISTGLSCGREGDPVLLRGLQEVIERDAAVGAWWGSYPLEAWPLARVRPAIDPALLAAALRPGLRFRFYRVASPFSDHVTIVTAEGEGRGGYAFSAGAACRETRGASLGKALLEAVQGQHYARWLLERARAAGGPPAGPPGTFAEHAVHFSLHPERLARTPLHAACAPPADADARTHAVEDLAALRARLGPERPVLFRLATPPGIAAEAPTWRVLKVLVPGLQPLHGNHLLPHLGGPLWAPRGLADHAALEPHPFP